MKAGVTVDTASLERGLRSLASGIDAAAQRAETTTASSTARAIRDRVPVRSGRLRASVAAVPIPGGVGVTYGGVPYAGYIEGRAHAVAQGVAGAPAAFHAAATAAAAEEVSRL